MGGACLERRTSERRPIPTIGGNRLRVGPRQRGSRIHLRGRPPHGARWQKETTDQDGTPLDAGRPVAAREPPVRFDDADARAHLFGAWTATALEKAEIAFSDIEGKAGRIIAVLGGHGDLEVHAHCHADDGLVSLTGVAISGFRMVSVPRVWDSPDRRDAERDPRDELGRLARRIKIALDEWTKSISALATWIRYSPPPPGAKPGRALVRRSIRGR